MYNVHMKGGNYFVTNITYMFLCNIDLHIDISIDVYVRDTNDMSHL